MSEKEKDKREVIIHDFQKRVYIWYSIKVFTVTKSVINKCMVYNKKETLQFTQLYKS